MSASEPSRDQLLAMAYVDDELDPEARAAFEQRLSREALLRREVSQLHELELLARAAIPKEPMDHEWQALARDPLQRGALGLGWILGGLGLLGLALYVLWTLFSAEGPPALKLFFGALLLGALLLFGAVLRGRLRTLPLDPYRKVQR